MPYQHIKVPESGAKITFNSDNSLNVPNNPIVVYIEGDGIGSDVSPTMKRVVDAAVAKAYGGDKSIAWLDAYCGENALDLYGKDQWMPAETLEAMDEFRVGIKGPLTTPIGGGIRSLNVALRQQLDLYQCVRPVRHFAGVPSPVLHPEYVDMVIFRENSEDIYAGIEWEADSPEAKKLINFLQTELGVEQIRFDDHCGIGVKPISKEGTQRLMAAAIDYAIDNDRSSVTIVHKGNIMKFTEGAFKQWSYDLAVEQYGAKPLDGGPWHVMKNPKTGSEIVIKDSIADAFLQELLIRPRDHDVIATMNLNGDYISDALAAGVGGIGIAPGANIGAGIALFEATHGTVPKYIGMDKVNPSSIILSAEMMLRYLGWFEAADLIIDAIQKAISAKTVTYDFVRLMDSATELKCSEYGSELVKHIQADA